MSSHNDVVYIKLDVRGAKGLGKRALYRHLGGVEVQDQLTTIRSVMAHLNSENNSKNYTLIIFFNFSRYLLDNFGFLDRSRIGVWGWGYGGYVTTMLLGTQQEIFKCGIAVSPITDWLYYST